MSRSAASLTDAEIELIGTWTAVDEDLDEVDADTANNIRSARLEISTTDLPRREYWRPVDGLVEINDVPYAVGSDRAHLLDVYRPSTRLAERRKKYPVYIDVHGGGFIYGYKELNKNFCRQLVARGFVVFSINYRLAPRATFLNQVFDVCQAFDWIHDHLEGFRGDPKSVFLVGDSAGATLALFALNSIRDKDFAADMGVCRPRLSINGTAFISGLFSLVDAEAVSFAPYIDHISEQFFDQHF